MKKLFTLILVFLANAALAAELKPIKDKDITFLLNNFVVIAESGHEAPDHARIIATTEPFECGGPWQNCPTSKLYVATSMIALDPPQKVYILPESKGWKFIKWLEEKEDKDGTPMMGVELHTSVPTANVTNLNTWKPKIYKVWFNTNYAEYEVK